MRLIWMYVQPVGNLGWIEILPHNPERRFERRFGKDHLSSFRHAVGVLSQCLIKQVAENFVRVWSDDCPAIETKCDVICSSAPCRYFRIMDISACPSLVYSCCTHCVSKTLGQTRCSHMAEIYYDSSSAVSYTGMHLPASFRDARLVPPWHHSVCIAYTISFAEAVRPKI